MIVVFVFSRGILLQLAGHVGFREVLSCTCDLVHQATSVGGTTGLH